MLEVVSLALVVILIGFRHGMDMDHVAAIADMVGVEPARKRQLTFGALYALGHGSIVIVMGMTVIWAGRRLPEGVVAGMEVLVGASLLLLGAIMLYSLVRVRKAEQPVVSRLQLIVQLFAKLRGQPASEASLTRYGVAGAFTIGIVHGIGAETPTQVMLFSSALRLDNEWGALLQLLLFVIGLLSATLLFTWLASWGYRQARKMRAVYFVLGALTGGYSIVLGSMILASV